MARTPAAFSPQFAEERILVATAGGQQYILLYVASHTYRLIVYILPDNDTLVIQLCRYFQAGGLEMRLGVRQRCGTCAQRKDARATARGASSSSPLPTQWTFLSWVVIMNTSGIEKFCPGLKRALYAT